MNTPENTPAPRPENNPDPADAILALAEEACPLVGRLVAALCKRPAPAQKARPADLEKMVEDLDRLLEEDMTNIEAAAFELVRADPDDIADILDDIEDSAHNLLKMAAKIWKTPLDPKAESLRPLLAALAERPVAELALYLQSLVQAALLAQDNQPQLPPDLEINVNPLFKDIADWQKSNPGVLKAEVVMPE